jgi:peptidoglycan hydrolase-like protein with peptidoglycan-binding domain
LSASHGPDRAARAPDPIGALLRGHPADDQIGALLRGEPVDEGSHLVRAAQIALSKLGYPVKPDGAEDGATRRAVLDFENAHGLAPSAEISPELVKRLTAAAGPGR